MSKLFRPFMRYRGNKICPDERTNKQTSRTDRPKHNDFTDIVEWPRHKNYDQSSITESNLAASMTRTSQSVNCWVSGRFFHTAADTDWLLTTVHCLATNLHSSTHHQYDTIMACKCYFRSLPSAQFHLNGYAWNWCNGIQFSFAAYHTFLPHDVIC